MIAMNAMKVIRRAVLAASAVALAGALTLPATALAGKPMVFGGGPAGGTFQVVASAIQDYGPVKAAEDYAVRARPSAGSVANLRAVDRGEMQFAVVYSGHAYLGREGRMKNDDRKYENVLAVSYLYGAPAQLVVRKDSGIASVDDLVGKRVGVGNAGSGAFANCELFFTHLGVWDRIERAAMGYNDAAAAFGNRQLDAFWVFTGFPSGAVTMAAEAGDIALVDLAKDAEDSAFFDKYPHFTKRSVPAGTYRGVAGAVPSFQDSALWVAGAEVPAEVVHDLLSRVYSREGLAYMRSRKKTFAEMSIESGVDGIVTPLHPGAERFWKENGVL